MAIVTIPPATQLELYQLAVDRNKGKHNNKRGWGGNTAEQNHYVGLLGEHAAERVLDGYRYDRQCYGAKGDGNMPDLVGPGGGINVKTRTKRGYDFALGSDSLDRFNAHAAVLVWPTQESQVHLVKEPKPLSHDISLDIVGIASYAVFAAKAHHVDYGYGKRLVLAAQHFTPIPRPLWQHEVAHYLKTRS